MKFNVNQVYSTRSIGDHDCIFHYLIVKRTETSVWIQPLNQWGEVQDSISRKKISLYEGEETIYPEGKYSMCPVLGAKDKNLLASPEKIKLQKEYLDINEKIMEYKEIALELMNNFSGEALKVRMQYHESEYGIDFLEKRLDKLRKQITAA